MTNAPAYSRTASGLISCLAYVRPHLTFNERGASQNRYSRKACRSTIYFSAYNEQACYGERKDCLGVRVVLVADVMNLVLFMRANVAQNHTAAAAQSIGCLDLVPKYC